LVQTSRAPNAAIRAELAISTAFSAPHMVLAVALSSQAQIATIATATSDCISADANHSTMPRRAVSWLATR